jgi:hypothetical protein
VQKNTHYPQVPVKVVKQIAEEDGTAEQSKDGESEQSGGAANNRSQNDSANVHAEKDTNKDS